MMRVLSCLAIASAGTGCGRLAFDAGPTVDAGSSVDTGFTVDADPPTVALVQSASGWSTSLTTARSVTLGAAPTAGNLIVVSVSTSFNVVVSVTDNAGNAYVGVPSNQTENSPIYCNIFVYYARNVVTTAGFTTTVTTEDTDHVTVAVHELAGADQRSPMAATVRTSGNGTAPTCGPVPGDSAGAHLASLCHNSTRATTFGSGFEILEAPTEAGNDNSPLVTAYKAGDGAATSVNATLSRSDDWQVILAAIR